MKINKIIVATIVCLFAGLSIFLLIQGLIDSRCADSFGPEFNKKRKELHIPIIPSGWKVYNSTETATLWKAPKVRKGHGFKVVVYDGCELDGEEDHYYFSSKKIQDTVLEVAYRYINKHRSKDSTVFVFQIGNHADTITRGKADSIFAANKIDRDF